MALAISWYLAALASLLFVLYHLFRNKFGNLKLPPGPWGLPVVGALPFLGEHPERVFAKWAKEYGPIISMRVGMNLLVVFNDYDSIYQTLLKRSSEFNGRPLVPLFQQITKGHGLILIDSTPLWKVQRKFGLTTMRGLGSGSTIMEDCVREELNYLLQSIKSHHGKPFNILSDLSNAVANNLCHLVMGRRFDYEDPNFEVIINEVREAFSDRETNRMFVLLTFVPLLANVPPFSNQAKKLVTKLNAAFDLFQEIIQEHKDTFHKHDIRDFIDSFLSEMEKKPDSSFTDFQLIQYVRDMFVAGTETTTSILRWGILCLIHYPNTQKKLKKEIQEVIGHFRSVKMSDKDNLPYTCAFIQEMFRFRTPVPLSVFHRATTDVEINGFLIPKGTTIAPNIWAVHNNGNRWQEPHIFDPERHLDVNGKFVSSPHVIPFSIGGRQCLGEQMAKMEVFMFLVSMVQKFEFGPDPSEKSLPDIEWGTNGLSFVPHSFHTVATES